MIYVNLFYIADTGNFEMKYISVSEFSKKFNIPERTVRNYCTTGKIKNALLTGKTWNIPEDTKVPEKKTQKKFSIILC